MFMEPVIKATRYHSGDLRVAMFALVQPGTRISFGLCIMVAERLLSFAHSSCAIEQVLMCVYGVSLNVRIILARNLRDSVTPFEVGTVIILFSFFFFIRWTNYVKVSILLVVYFAYKLSLFRVWYKERKVI